MSIFQLGSAGRRHLEKNVLLIRDVIMKRDGKYPAQGPNVCAALIYEAIESKSHYMWASWTLLSPNIE